MWIRERIASSRISPGFTEKAGPHCVVKFGETENHESVGRSFERHPSPSSTTGISAQRPRNPLENMFTRTLYLAMNWQFALQGRVVREGGYFGAMQAEGAAGTSGILRILRFCASWGHISIFNICPALGICFLNRPLIREKCARYANSGLRRPVA